MTWEDVFWSVALALGDQYNERITIYLGYNSRRKTFHVMRLYDGESDYSLDCRVKPFPKNVKYVKL